MKDITQIINDFFVTKNGYVYVSKVTLHLKPLAVEFPDGIDIEELMKFVEELRNNGYNVRHITSTIIGKPETIREPLAHRFSMSVKSAVMVPIIKMDNEKR